ncbi:hypothetical protein [Burkholderia sp. Ac-20353]|uniref:hypothetical protein n=1 Tax=Burkholderia sp. Ac-20353 TaxID=2703894 RepID=UPI00197B8D54|nr:hypothetical protein [Burkholderia sp. Ac-20353]MBN3786111.1 hypothetical protein [Burkholderia sp. Ac-20353]
MHKLFKHPLAKPLAIGVLLLAVLAGSAAGSLPWFIERYMRWVAEHLAGRPLRQCMPGVIGFALLGATGVLATFQLSAVAITIVAQRLNGETREQT